MIEQVGKEIENGLRKWPGCLGLMAGPSVWGGYKETKDTVVAVLKKRVVLEGSSNTQTE